VSFLTFAPIASISRSSIPQDPLFRFGRLASLSVLRSSSALIFAAAAPADSGDAGEIGPRSFARSEVKRLKKSCNLSIGKIWHCRTFSGFRQFRHRQNFRSAGFARMSSYSFRVIFLWQSRDRCPLTMLGWRASVKDCWGIGCDRWHDGKRHRNNVMPHKSGDSGLSADSARDRGDRVIADDWL
jgi:hypothetical protein